jgi:hypothetical protein
MCDFNRLDNDADVATIFVEHGRLVLDMCRVYGNMMDAQASGVIAMSGGTCQILNSEVISLGGNTAINLALAETQYMVNILSGVVVAGDIKCGGQSTIIDNIYHAVGQTTGTALILKDASAVANNSMVAGVTVKDALDWLGGTIRPIKKLDIAPAFAN